VAATSSLARLASTVEVTIQTQAQTGGGSVVRIKLTPPELGEVRVQLTQTSAGLVARVVADHQAAAQTLQQSAGDLRRALEGSGIALAQLDIGSSDSQSTGAQSDEEGPQNAGGAAAGETTDEADTGETTTTTLSIGAGAVVNVLA
jgi:flagellar hook-length control protein FliK